MHVGVREGLGVCIIQRGERACVHYVLCKHPKVYSSQRQGSLQGNIFLCIETGCAEWWVTKKEVGLTGTQLP